MKVNSIQLSIFWILGLLGFWPFNRKYEGQDVSGNGNQALLHNLKISSWISNDSYTTSSYSFLGANDSYAFIANRHRSISFSNAFTVLLQVKPEAVSEASNMQCIYSHSGGKLELCLYGNDTGYSKLLLKYDQDTRYIVLGNVTSKWLTISIVYNATSNTLLVMELGTLLYSQITNNTDHLHGNLYIGRTANNSMSSSYFRGKLNCIQMYGIPLNQMQIQRAFSWCLNETYWPLELLASTDTLERNMCQNLSKSNCQNFTGGQLYILSVAFQLTFLNMSGKQNGSVGYFENSVQNLRSSISFRIYTFLCIYTGQKCERWGGGIEGGGTAPCPSCCYAYIC